MFYFLKFNKPTHLHGHNGGWWETIWRPGHCKIKPFFALFRFTVNRNASVLLSEPKISPIHPCADLKQGPPLFELAISNGCAAVEVAVCVFLSPNATAHHSGYLRTRWRRLIGSPKLQTIFHKRATKYMSLLRKLTYKDKGSYESSPPCSHQQDVSAKNLRARQKHQVHTPIHPSELGW